MNQKKFYYTPDVEVSIYYEEDVIRTSGDDDRLEWD